MKPLQRVIRILVATDCLPQSKKLVDHAFELKELFNCEILLLHVIDWGSALRFGIRQGYLSDLSAKLRTWVRHQLQNLSPHRFLSDPSVHLLVEEGPVSQTIAQYADDYDVDMVILGARAHPLHQQVLGTTTQRILSAVRRPLLTVSL